MTPYEKNQELSDIRWWTGMPTALMVGSEIIQVRARGIATLAIVDADKAATVISDPGDLESSLRPLIAASIIEALGELGQTVAAVTQLTTINATTINFFTAKLDNRLADAGLQVKQLEVEAIESV